MERNYIEINIAFTSEPWTSTHYITKDKTQKKNTENIKMNVTVEVDT